jgi:AraC-like DNA-binding protein
MRQALVLDPKTRLHALNGGLFISRGKGIHPDRKIDSYELIFVRSGVLGMQEERRAFRLEAGQTLVLWPHRRHLGTVAYPPDLSFYWIHFRLGTAPKSRSREALRVPQVGRPERPERLTEVLHQFLEDQEAGALQSLQAAALIQLALSEAARAPTPPKSEHGTARVLAARAERYFAVHYHESVSTSRVAHSLRCNPDYLGRVYRRAYGFALTDGLHRHRVRAARALLIEGRWNVDEIARECGFEDAGYFRRIFKRHVGLTPRAFRHLHARAYVNTE